MTNNFSDMTNEVSAICSRIGGKGGGVNIDDVNKHGLKFGYEYEDNIPKLNSFVYGAMFKASYVDGVRLFPYVEIKGERFYLVKIQEEPTQRIRKGKQRKDYFSPVDVAILGGDPSL